jgi:cytochrome c oxidase subunit 2
VKSDYPRGNRQLNDMKRYQRFRASSHLRMPGIRLADRQAGSVSLRVLLGVLVLAGALGIAGDPAQGAQERLTEPRVIEVVAKRYAFEPAQIDAAVGERLRLMVVSADGVHGVEIPRGTTPVAIEFTPTEAGQFPILCSEYCGDGHADMKGMLVVTAQAAPASQEKN